MALYRKQPRGIPALVRFDFESFRQQAIVFSTLNLFLLAALLLLHSLFASLLGTPSAALLVTLGTAFLLKMLELLWLWAGVRSPSRTLADVIVLASIALNMILALLLSFLTKSGDSPYFVLLALPVLQAAYRFRLPACIAVILLADSMIILWVWYFGRYHSQFRAIEYLESGVLLVVYALMGSLVWLLVNQLRVDQTRLSRSLIELEQTREKLIAEEKLAMAGRLSSAVAHEIRNPVAIIASSLVTAGRPELQDEQRKEMYAIARNEAARLEKLTADFLSYARPREPKRNPVQIAGLLSYVAEIATVQCAKGQIGVTVESGNDLAANIDGEQLQRALLNLLLNAIDATPPGGKIVVRARSAHQSLEVQVENSGNAIPDEVLSKIFEPFYTTKANGTGLGLAISKNIARAQGGDLVVSRNEPGRVCFTMTVSDLQMTPCGENAHG